MTDVAGKKVEIKDMAPGSYRVRIYHTWKGVFQDTLSVTCVKGTVAFVIPTLQMGQHANYIGPDVAFILDKDAKQQ